jgi:flagellar motor switch protein FliG
MAVLDTSKLNGLEKASVLLMALGTSASAQVFKHLSEAEIEKLSSEIVKMRKVDPEISKAVLAEFESMSAGAHLSSMSPIKGLAVEQYARPDIVELDGAPSKQSRAGRKRPFESVSQADAGRIAEMLSDEQPQIIALVLTGLPKDKAAEVLARFDEHTQVQIAVCICDMAEVAPEVLAVVEEVLHTKLASAVSETPSGIRALVDMLNNADSATGHSILDVLSKDDASFAEQVRAGMFIFEDLIRLSDSGVQALLREVDYDDLQLALKGSEEEMKDLIFRNMSERAGEALKEALELTGAVKVKHIEAAQHRIAATARRLLAGGDISLSDVEEEKVA